MRRVAHCFAAIQGRRTRQEARTQTPEGIRQPLDAVSEPSAVVVRIDSRDTLRVTNERIAAEETMAKKRVTEAVVDSGRTLTAPRTSLPPKGDGHRSPTAPAWRGSSSCSRPACPGRCCRPELGYGSGSTCWRRFRAWTRLGVWPELHRRLLRILGRRGRINLERAVIDSASVRALKRGAHRPEPHGSREERLQTPHRDRRRPGSRWWSAPARPISRMRSWPWRCSTPSRPAPAGEAGRDVGPGTFQGDGAYGIKAIVAEVVQRRVHVAAGAVWQGAEGARQRAGQDPLCRRADAQLGRATSAG